MQALVDYFSGNPLLALSAIFVASFLESLAVVGTVVPGSSIVFIGGVLVGLGALGPWEVTAVALGGAILGDGASYWLGSHYHDRLLQTWPIKQHPGVLHRGIQYFARNGRKSIFVGRFIGPVRAIVPVVAGMSNMPPRQFYTINALSALAWAAAHIAPGALFGASLQVAGAVSTRLVLLLVAIVVCFWLAARLVRLAYGWLWPLLKWPGRRDKPVQALSLWLGVVTLAALGLLYGVVQVGTQAIRLTDRPVAADSNLPQWTDEGWMQLPRARSELGGDPEEPFSVQWAGTAGHISDTLHVLGWQVPVRWSFESALLWLVPQTSIRQLPVLPKLDYDQEQKLTFVKVLNGHERIVLRLWPSSRVVQPGGIVPAQPLWTGMITTERLSRIPGVVTLARAAADQDAPLATLRNELQGLRLTVEKQTPEHGHVLLVW